MADQKSCFIACPIGPEDSEVRRRSDEVFEFVIAPPVKEAGYDPIRSDHISKTGDINEQIIEQLINAPLVIADLSGLNPNVFYELAIRHMVRKPFIQLRSPAEAMPFDVAMLRTIDLDPHSLRSANTAKRKISEFIKSIESDTGEIITPISRAFDWVDINKSENPEKRQTAELVRGVEEIKEVLQILVSKSRKKTPVDIPVNAPFRGVLNMTDTEISNLCRSLAAQPAETDTRVTEAQMDSFLRWRKEQAAKSPKESDPND